MRHANVFAIPVKNRQHSQGLCKPCVITDNTLMFDVIYRSLSPPIIISHRGILKTPMKQLGGVLQAGPGSSLLVQGGYFIQHNHMTANDPYETDGAALPHSTQFLEIPKFGVSIQIFSGACTLMCLRQLMRPNKKATPRSAIRIHAWQS